MPTEMHNEDEEEEDYNKILFSQKFVQLMSATKKNGLRQKTVIGNDRKDDLKAIEKEKARNSTQYSGSSASGKRLPKRKMTRVTLN